MKKILLLCAAGMSTSILVNKMKEAANKNTSYSFILFSKFSKLTASICTSIPFLLGPQVRFKKNELQEKANALGKPLDVINTMDYGLMKGDKVLEFALNLIK